MALAREVILAQSAAWDRPLSIDRYAPRDVRQILNSMDGPAHFPSVRTGILLSEIDGPSGLRTLFVSNVADGFSSMIYMASRRIGGLHFSIQTSSYLCNFPRNAFSVIMDERDVRVVYSMRDANSWEFFQKGEPLSFEDVSFYDAKKKRDRLTPSIISTYLVQIGYGSLEKDFWISAAPGHLLCESEFRLWKIPINSNP